MSESDSTDALSAAARSGASVALAADDGDGVSADKTANDARDRAALAKEGRRLRRLGLSRWRSRITLFLFAGLVSLLALMPWSDFVSSLKHFPPPPSSGPYETRIAEVEVPGGLGRAGETRFFKQRVRLFYPIAPAEEEARAARGGWPLLLYMPGWLGRAVDNDPMLLNLASFGYVVAAIDDVVHDQAATTEQAETRRARLGEVDYSSAGAFQTTLDLLALRVSLSAQKMIHVLDGLLVASHPDGSMEFPVVVDVERIAAIGFSFGGGAALEAMDRDERIRAAINMDGLLFGVATERRMAGPYLEFRSSATPHIVPGWMVWSRPSKKYLLLEREMSRAASKLQLSDADAHLVSIWGARHEDFSRELHDRQRWAGWRPWLPPLTEAERVRMIVDAYVLAFLQTYLLEQPHELISAETSVFPEVALKE